MKKIIKNKIILIVILCIISCGIGVYAATTYKATDVIYNASDGTSMNVSEALNELYNRSNNNGFIVNWKYMSSTRVDNYIVPINKYNSSFVSINDNKIIFKKTANIYITASGSTGGTNNSLILKKNDSSIVISQNSSGNVNEVFKEITLNVSENDIIYLMTTGGVPGIMSNWFIVSVCII